MNEITAFLNLDLPSIILGIFIILSAIRLATSILEWLCSKLGIEWRWMRNNREIKSSLEHLSDSIHKIGIQIDGLCIKNELAEAASREALADRINQRYKYYLQLNGIPEDEVDEFEQLHTAYKGVGGNHSGDAKYEYCMQHLPIIPVETRRYYEKTSHTSEGKRDI